MYIWGIFPHLALVEYRTKGIRIMQGPGVIFKLTSADNSWKYHQIVLTEDRFWIFDLE